MARELKFKNPSFYERLRGMLGVDFYRLFHTPLFYIFLAIAAIIPAMILGTGGMENPQTGEVSAQLYTNVWHIIAAESPLYVINNIGEYANMNMVFIFGGIMVSIFIGHDYKSGYVKQLFTTHAKKQDYMMSKTISCAFAMACMCVTYLLGAVTAGLLTGLNMTVNVGSLLIAIFGKMVSSFFFGTGILIIGAAAIVESLTLPTSFLNIFLYGSSVNACLTSNAVTLLTCVVVSVVWAFIYNIVGSLILSKSDVY